MLTDNNRPFSAVATFMVNGRMREIAQTRVRYGYRRVHVLLKRKGWQLGKNQMYRLYSEGQLQLLRIRANPPPILIANL